MPPLLFLFYDALLPFCSLLLLFSDPVWPLINTRVAQDTFDRCPTWLAIEPLGNRFEAELLPAMQLNDLLSDFLRVDVPAHTQGAVSKVRN